MICFKFYRFLINGCISAHIFLNYNVFKFDLFSGVDFQVRNLMVDDHLVALQLWDTAAPGKVSKTFTITDCIVLSEKNCVSPTVNKIAHQ